MLKRFVFWLTTKAVELQFKMFGPYYDRLYIQSLYLYRSSTLYKARWQMFGTDFAEQAFRDSSGEQHLFFTLAKRQPFVIRYQIFKDAMCGREARPYGLSSRST